MYIDLCHIDCVCAASWDGFLQGQDKLSFQVLKQADYGAQLEILR